MKVKIVCCWAVVQIVIGLALLGGTASVAGCLLPRIGNAVSEAGDGIADAAKALKGNNAVYSASATNLFSLSESMGSTVGYIGEIGGNVMRMGGSLHSDKPILKRFNGVGDGIQDVGSAIVNVAGVIRNQQEIIRDYRDVVHPQNVNTLNETAEILKDLSALLKDESATKVYFAYVCLIGALLSLLFVMNGVILMTCGNVKCKDPA